MFTLTGYNIHRQLYESEHSRIYRADRGSDGCPVILKCLNYDHPTPQQRARFQWEYDLTRRIHAKSVIRAYALEALQHSPVMVLEDIGAEALHHIFRSTTLTLPEALTIAIDIAGALDAVHAAGLIHKDVNPANIVYNPSTRHLQLIDFGIAAQCDLKTSYLGNPEMIEGTLPYIAPEQTGRMNRMLDNRADLYAFGITLYELLTGQLPFASRDALQLVYEHLTVIPHPPGHINPDIPPILSEIIMTLLAKNADDRYQSAHGVQVDLETCLRQISPLIVRREGKQGRYEIPEFPLAQNDVSEGFRLSLRLPQKLYGREQELTALLAAFERVSTAGTPETLLVAGPSGSGKSALAQELYKPITGRRGLWLSGKFDQFQRNVPYYALRQAFDEFAAALLTEPEEQLHLWRERILQAVGNAGQVVLDVIPRLKLIIGDQPPVIEVGPQETQNRFRIVWQNFLLALVQPGDPIVIFLDDVQWADAASLDLLKTWLTDPQLHHLLLILAYRDNETLPGHALLTMIDDLQQAAVPITAQPVRNLNSAHINALISETFACDPAYTQPLSETLFAQTDGNILFTRQLLITFVETGRIWWDTQQRQWRWNPEPLDVKEVSPPAENGHSDEDGALQRKFDIVALMQQRLQRLPAATQTLLGLAACIGNTFDLALLSIISEHTLQETLTDLEPAIRTQVILPLNTQYQYATVEPERGQFRFLHDRVQQNAYTGIAEDRKASVHLRIGRLLRQNATPDEQDDHLFAIVQHLNRGHALLTDAAERQELAELNLSAGQKALAAAAYQAAAEFAGQGAAFLPDNAWEYCYDTTLAIHTIWAGAMYMARHLEDAERLFTMILTHARAPLDQIPVYLLQIDHAWSQGSSAWLDIGRTALAELGVRLPAKHFKLATMFELLKTALAMRRRATTELFQRPLMTDPLKQAAMQILTRLLSVTINSLPDLYPLLILQMVQISLRYGNSPFAGVGYAMYRVLLLLAGLGGIDEFYTVMQAGLGFTDRSDMQRAAWLQWSGYIFFAAHCKAPLRDSWPYFHQTMNLCLEAGELQGYGYAVYAYLNYRLFSGEPLASLLDDHAQAVALLKKTRLPRIENVVRLWQQLLLTLTGTGSVPWQLAGPVWDERADFSCMVAQDILDYDFAHLWLAWLTEHWSAGIDYARKLEQRRAVLVTGEHVNCIDIFSGICATNQATTAHGVQRLRLIIEARRSQRRLRAMAQHCAANYEHKYRLLSAELARLQGKIPQAMTLYDQAIAGAREQQFLHEEALANECAARFYLQVGQENFAAQYLRAARDAYARWGCMPKVRLLEEKYPGLLSQPTAVVHVDEHQQPGSNAPPVEPTTKIRMETFEAKPSALDVTTLLRASQILAQEVHLDQLLRRIMELMLENAGAERGALLLKENDAWSIQASGSPADGIQVLQNLALDAASDPSERLLCRGIVDYVARSGERLVLADAGQDRRFARDVYLQHYQVKSALCLPLLHQGQMVGILYLENNLTPGAFTPERLEILDILAVRAAISLENARLYAALSESNRLLEERVRMRTLDLEESNRALRTAHKSAETANRSKNAFMAHISHELRTPLNAILGYTQLLRRDQALNEKHLDAVATIHHSGEHLLLLINDLLDISRIEAQKMDLHPTPFPFSLFLRNLVETVRMRAGQKNLLIITEFAPDLPATVIADERRLRQILLNLLNNAIKFTEQGQVALRVTTRSSGVLESWGTEETLKPTIPPRPPDSPTLQHSNSPLLHFEISDTGPGIPPEHLPHIFDAFYQGNRYPVEEGSGLGLSISQQLVRLMGSELCVNSTVGQGSTFWFDLKLPVAEAGAADKSVQARQVLGYAGARRKILLVDDNAENRGFLRDLLVSLGFELQEVADGRDALAIIPNWQPRLILLDLLMPGMDGFETARQIRSAEAEQGTDNLKSQISLIAISASVSESVYQESLSAGCDDFLAKPVKIADLLECLRRHLQLEWVHATSTEPDAASRTSEPPAIPPFEVLRQLIRLADSGYVNDLEDLLAKLAQNQAAYLPFVTKIRALARDLHLQQIVEELKPYLQQHDSL